MADLCVEYVFFELCRGRKSRMHHGELAVMRRCLSE